MLLCSGVSNHNILSSVTSALKNDKLFYPFFCPAACWLLKEFWNVDATRKAIKEARERTGMDDWERSEVSVTCCTDSQNLGVGGTSDVKRICFFSCTMLLPEGRAPVSPAPQDCFHSFLTVSCAFTPAPTPPHSTLISFSKSS